MEEWISQREMGRRSDRTHRAVQKAIADGRIPAAAVRRGEDGRIEAVEYHAALAGLKANTDPVEAARNGKLSAPAPVQPGGGASLNAKPDLVAAAGGDADAVVPNNGTAAAGGDAGGWSVPPAQAGDQGDYLAARAKREGFLAKQAELDYLEQIGRLVSSEEVEREVAEIFSQLKSSVFLVSDRKAQILAAELDPVRVHRLLIDEFRTVFDEFSGRLASSAAAGVAEREAALP